MKIPHRWLQAVSMAVEPLSQHQANRLQVVFLLASVSRRSHTFLTRLAQPFTGSPAHTQSKSVLVIFVLEIVVKFIAEERSPWLFFTDNWNVFDFLIAFGFMPMVAGVDLILRLLRRCACSSL